MNVYYVADVRSLLSEAAGLPVPADVEVRPMLPADVEKLAELYVRAHDLAVDALGDAVREMESAVDGTWGAFWAESSPVAWWGSTPIAVVQTVHRPAMEDAPRCPWLIEVLTDPGHRRRGLARHLIRHVCSVMADASHDRVGLTVDTDNEAAVKLYRSLGFAPAD